MNRTNETAKWLVANATEIVLTNDEGFCHEDFIKIRGIWYDAFTLSWGHVDGWSKAYKPEAICKALRGYPKGQTFFRTDENPDSLL